MEFEKKVDEFNFVRCVNCLMPNTKPGLVFDKEGKCQACNHAELKKKVDYKKRFEELKELCKKYKRNDGYYDCVIAVSGGKDSHFQVYLFKEVLGMNPLLVTVDCPFEKTNAGIHNLKNVAKVFSCDMIEARVSSVLLKKIMRLSFEKYCTPTWAIDRAIYAVPVSTALRFKIPLLVYGENVSYEYGGVLEKETYSAKNQINNDVAKNIDFEVWYKNGIKKEELNMLQYPSSEEIEKAKLDPIYLNYFVKWDGYKNYELAKKYGFKDLSGEWKREGFIENYDQIDSIGYTLHAWLKYPKFGFQRATDVVGYWIRSGRITKKEGIKLIKENDYKLDKKVLKDFLNFAGYSEKEFWDIVENFWNKNIFEKVNGKWVMKKEAVQQNA